MLDVEIRKFAEAVIADLKPLLDDSLRAFKDPARQKRYEDWLAAGGAEKYRAIWDRMEAEDAAH